MRRSLRVGGFRNRTKGFGCMTNRVNPGIVGGRNVFDFQGKGLELICRNVERNGTGSNFKSIYTGAHYSGTVILMNTQKDLRWSLADFEQPQLASDFYARFNGAFAVYSKSVRKVYTEYSTEVIAGPNPVLMIQPDMLEFTSMFHNIERDAITRTSIVLYVDGDDLRLSGVMAGSQDRRSFSLQDGLYKLFSGAFVDGAFLPVVTYGDLRTLPDQTRPILQLHGLQLHYLQNLSTFQVQDLIETLKRNLIERLT